MRRLLPLLLLLAAPTYAAFWYIGGAGVDNYARQLIQDHVVERLPQDDPHGVMAWVGSATVPRVGNSNSWAEIIGQNLYIRELVPGVITNVVVVEAVHKPNSLEPPPLYQSFVLSTESSGYRLYTNEAEWVSMSWSSFVGAWVGNAGLRSGVWDIGPFTAPGSPTMKILAGTGPLGNDNKSYFVVRFEEELIRSEQLLLPIHLAAHNTDPESHDDIRQLISSIPYPPSNLSAGWKVWDAGSNCYWTVTATNLQFYVYP